MKTVPPDYVQKKTNASALMPFWKMFMILLSPTPCGKGIPYVSGIQCFSLWKAFASKICLSTNKANDSRWDADAVAKTSPR